MRDDDNDKACRALPVFKLDNNKINKSPSPSSSPPSSSSGQTLTSRVAKGTAWVVAARFSMRAIGFINMIIVARLLVPTDFGLVAIGVAAMQLIQGFSNIGLAQAVVKFRDATRDDYDTLFTLSLLRGVLIAIILGISGFFAISFYNDPRMLVVFAAVAAVSLVMGVINPKYYEFERDLDFSREFLATVSDKIVSVVISVSLTLIFRSYWALLAGMLAGVMTQCAFSYYLRPYLPRLTFASFAKVISFSGWLTGVSFVVALNNKFDGFVLARIIGLEATGVYTIGGQLSSLVSTELSEPVARAIYPGLSQMQGDLARMQSAFLQGVGAIAAVALPAGFGVAFVAKDLVLIVLGEKWLDATLVLQYLPPMLGFMSSLLSMHYFAIACDRTRLVFFREVAYAFIKIPVFVWAVIHYGFAGAVYAVTALSGIYGILQMILYGKITGDAIWRPLWAMRRSLLAVVMMGVWFWFCVPLMPFLAQLPIVIRLAFNIMVGGGLYCLGHLALWHFEGRPDGVETRIAALVGQKLLARGQK